MSELAIFGGTPVVGGPLPHYNSLGREELAAVTGVIESGVLSGFFSG